MFNLKVLMRVAAVTLAAGLVVAPQASALSSGSSSGSSTGSATGSSSALSSGSSVGSISSGDGLLSSVGSSVLDFVFPEDHEAFLRRITDPTDDSQIPLHPVLNEELYNEVFDPPQMGECPAVTVVAARGSEQNFQIRPTRYSEGAPWTSNGFEERNIRAMMAKLEQHHVAETGQSLMKDVYVMGLTDVDYPASLPLSSDGSTAIDFGTSLSSGRDNVIRSIDRFEAETGCQSKYLLVGYSQGVLVVDGQEEELIRRDQYVGTVLIANPALHRDDTTVVGHQPLDGGIVSSSDSPEALHPHKINYCLPGDVVCDRSPAQFSTAGSSMAAAQLSTGTVRNGSMHIAYFIRPNVWDAEVFDAVSGWITESVVGLPSTDAASGTRLSDILR